jgi:hypothetical protein
MLMVTPKAGSEGGGGAVRLMVKDWSRQFSEPIPLPKGKPLVTLRDAAVYITKLPKAEHTAPEVAGCNGMSDPGGREKRPDHDGAHRLHAGVEQKR